MNADPQFHAIQLGVPILVPAVLSFFLVALLAVKRPKSLPDYVLAVWLTLIGLHSTAQYLIGPPNFTTLANLSLGFPFLQGAFLLFYVDSLTSGRKYPRRRRQQGSTATHWYL